MRLVALCIALLLGMPAWASTYRIDVSGNFETVTLPMVYSSGGSSGAFELTPDASLLSAHYNRELLNETSGTALFDQSTGHYSECGGMLRLLCGSTIPDRRTSIADRFFRNYGDFGTLVMDGASIQYATDGLYRWSADGESYVSIGLVAAGSLGSVSISAVPLPPAGMALMASLGMIGLLSRNRRRRLLSQPTARSI